MARKVNESRDHGGAARILNLPAPTTAGEPARQADLDAIKAALSWRDPVRAASTGNVTLTSPGATLDGVTLAAGNRVLLKDQTTGSENGIYAFNGAASSLTRAGDVIHAGTALTIAEGSVNGDTTWFVTTNDPITVGTTALVWATLGPQTSAGTGLAKSGNTILLTTPVAVVSGGTGSTTAVGARTNLAAVGKYGADFGDGVATSFNVDHNLGTTDVVVDIYLKLSGALEECDVTVVNSNRVTLSGFAAAPAAGAYRAVVLG